MSDRIRVPKGITMTDSSDRLNYVVPANGKHGCNEGLLALANNAILKITH